MTDQEFQEMDELMKKEKVETLTKEERERLSFLIRMVLKESNFGYGLMGEVDQATLKTRPFAVRYKTGMDYLISGERRNAFVYEGNLTENELRIAWDKAYRRVLKRAMDGEIIIDCEQEQIMKELSKTLEGFRFYEDV